MVLPPLDASARRRLQHFAAAIIAIWYARKTVSSIHDNHALLRLQRELQTASRWTLATRVLRYTFMSQLIASMEYLIPLVKPVLALRIGQLIVGKPRDEVFNLVYGPHPRNMIDVFGVDQTGAKPVVLFIHGGAWSYGHKWQYGLVGRYLAQHGFLVGVINYRTYPTGAVQDQVQDVVDAIHWIVEHAEEYGGDHKRVFLSGHSSGAHVGALALAQSALHATERHLDVQETQTETKLVHHHIQGFIGLAGPYDITEHYDFEANRKVGPIDGVHELSTMKPAMLGEDKFDESSPTKLFRKINARDVAMPRFHILHGSADEVVPASSSKKLADSLRQSGHDVEYVELDGCSHEDILFAAMGDNVASKRELVAHFKRITGHADDASPPRAKL